MSPFCGVTRKRHSSTICETQYPVRSMGAAAWAGRGGARWPLRIEGHGKRRRGCDKRRIVYFPLLKLVYAASTNMSGVQKVFLS